MPWAIAGLPLSVSPAPIPARERSLPSRRLLLSPPSDRFAGREAKVLRVSQQVGTQNVLSLRTDEDRSILPVMGCLVLDELRLPDLAAAVDVARAELADFSRPRTGQHLKPNHCRDDWREEGQDGVNNIHADRLDRLCLAKRRAPFAQSGNDRQCLGM